MKQLGNLISDVYLQLVNKQTKIVTVTRAQHALNLDKRFSKTVLFQRSIAERSKLTQSATKITKKFAQFSFFGFCLSQSKLHVIDQRFCLDQTLQE